MEYLEFNYKFPQRKFQRKHKVSIAVHIEEIGNELLTHDLWRYNIENPRLAYRGVDTKTSYIGRFETKAPEELPI